MMTNLSSSEGLAKSLLLQLMLSVVREEACGQTVLLGQASHPKLSLLIF